MTDLEKIKARQTVERAIQRGLIRTFRPEDWRRVVDWGKRQGLVTAPATEPNAYLEYRRQQSRSSMSRIRHRRQAAGLTGNGQPRRRRRFSALRGLSARRPMLYRALWKVLSSGDPVGDEKANS